MITEPHILAMYIKWNHITTQIQFSIQYENGNGNSNTQDQESHTIHCEYMRYGIQTNRRIYVFTFFETNEQYHKSESVV